MSTQTIGGFEVHVDEEGFMTEPGEWSEDLAPLLAKEIGIDELTDEHWKAIRFLRDDFSSQGTTPTLRRVSTMGGIATKDLYKLFPKQPAKKMAYIAGLQKPTGCV
jgi:tRNA 2-thiouridine synthesizing protein E